MGDYLAMLMINIVVHTMIILIGLVLKTGYGADFIKFFNEKKYDRTEYSKIVGSNIIIMSSLSILNTVLYCFSSKISLSENVYFGINIAISIIIGIRVAIKVNKYARINTK